MSRQIIQQPDGKFSIWSDNVDAFIMTNATEKYIIDFFAEEARQFSELQTRLLLQKIERGEKVYGLRTVTYAEAVEIVKHKKGEA